MVSHGWGSLLTSPARFVSPSLLAGTCPTPRSEAWFSTSATAASEARSSRKGSTLHTARLSPSSLTRRARRPRPLPFCRPRRPRPARCRPRLRVRTLARRRSAVSSARRRGRRTEITRVCSEEASRAGGAGRTSGARMVPGGEHSGAASTAPRGVTRLRREGSRGRTLPLSRPLRLLAARPRSQRRRWSSRARLRRP